MLEIILTPLLASTLGPCDQGLYRSLSASRLSGGTPDRRRSYRAGCMGNCICRTGLFVLAFFPSL